MKCERCDRRILVPDVSSMSATAALGAGMAIGVHLMDHKKGCAGKLYDWPDRHPDGLSFEERLQQISDEEALAQFDETRGGGSR